MSESVFNNVKISGISFIIPDNYVYKADDYIHLFENNEKKEVQIVEEESYRIEKEDVIEVKDSTTNVSVNVDNTNWTNEGQNSVNFVITLDSSTAKNNLFKNPTIKINLPKEVEKVILGDSQLLYSNGLSLVNVETQNNEDGSISILATLNGSQTQYQESNLGLVTTLTIPANIMIRKDLENNMTSKINTIYTNEYDSTQGEINQDVSITAYIGQNTVGDNVISNNETSIGEIIADKKDKIMNTVFKDIDADEYGLKVKIDAYKGDENKPLTDSDIVYSGEYITYKITYTTEKEIDNLKFVVNIPEGLTYGKLSTKSDDLFERSYEYEFFGDQREVVIEEENIKSGITYVEHVDCKVNDLEESKEIETDIKTYIEEQEVKDDKIKHVLEHGEASIFIKPLLDGFGDEWVYNVSINTPEEEASTIKLIFPEGVKIEQQTIVDSQSFVVPSGGLEEEAVTYEFGIDEETGRDNVTVNISRGGNLELEIHIKILDPSKIIELYRESLKTTKSDEDYNMRAYATMEVGGKTYYSNEGKTKRYCVMSL